MARPTEVRPDGVYMWCRACGGLLIKSMFFNFGLGRYSRDCLKCDPQPVRAPKHVRDSPKRRRQLEVEEALARNLRLLHQAADELEEDRSARPIAAQLEADYWTEGPRGKSFPTVRRMTKEEEAQVRPTLPHRYLANPKVKA